MVEQLKADAHVPLGASLKRRWLVLVSRQRGPVTDLRTFIVSNSDADPAASVRRAVPAVEVWPTWKVSAAPLDLAEQPSGRLDGDAPPRGLA